MNIEEDFTAKTASHARKLQEALGKEIVFGRSDVQRVLDLKPTRGYRIGIVSRERTAFLMWLTCFSAVFGTCNVKRMYSYSPARSRNACGE